MDDDLDKQEIKALTKESGVDVDVTKQRSKRR